MIKISYQKNEESNKIRKPNTTDNEILSFLKNKGEPQKFQEIAVGLKFSSGKLQTAIKRLEKNEKIVKKKVPIDNGQKHVTKIFLEDFSTEVLVPFFLDEVTAKIIEKVPEVSPKFSSLDELIREAIETYFQKNIPGAIKIKAIEKAVAEGLLTKELGDELLGR